MANTQDKLAKAKTLIQAKQYAEARKLLEGVDHPMAEKWRVKLDDILDDPFADDEKPKRQAPVQVIVQQKRSNTCLILVLLFVVCGIISMVILALAGNSLTGGKMADAPDADAQPMVFTSDEYGLQAVIGPVDIPSGRWKVTGTTVGYMTADIEATSGTCDDGIFGLFLMARGQMNDGAETTFESDDCRGVISISNTQESWTIRFDPIR